MSTTPKSMRLLAEKTLNILDRQLSAHIHTYVNALVIRLKVPHNAEYTVHNERFLTGTRRLPGSFLVSTLAL